MNSVNNDSREPPGGKNGVVNELAALLHLSPDDVLNVVQSFAGMFVLGMTGSGKTSAVGFALALAMLRRGYGFLVLTTKPGEAEAWVEWARIAGRAKDVRVFGPQHKWRFALLNYAFTQNGSRGGNDTDNVVALLSEIVNFKNRNKESEGENKFWYESAKRALGHAIDLLACAGEPVSFAGIYAIFQSIPRSLEELGSKEWQKGFLNQLVNRSAANKSLSKAKENDLRLAFEYFLGTVPRMDERVRSNIMATLDSITYLFLRGQVANLCGGEESTV